MSRENIVVIGTGMAGFRVCEQLVDAGAGGMRIVAFGDEPIPPYDRVHLTEYLDGRSVDDLLLQPRDWYAEHDIELCTGDRVAAINREARLVRTESGRLEPYDQLVIATGARPFVPPIRGIDADNVFVYRTVDDLDRIRKRAACSLRGAVIGGGLLGLEAAHALTELDLEVHVIEAQPHLMPRQLDAASAKVLERRVTELGVTVFTDLRTRSVRGECGGLLLDFENDYCLAVDLLVVAAGVRPRDELAKECGLDVAARGGIVIDDATRTSDERIFAVGDCASHRGVVYGLAGPGYQMADVAADRIAGGRARFVRGDTSCRLKLLGVDVAVLGELDEGAEAIAWETEHARRTIALREGRLVGAAAVGRWGDLWRVDAGIAAERRLGRGERRRFAETGTPWAANSALPVREWPANALVCNCRRVSRCVLTTEIADGHRTVEALGKRTGAGSVCGSCSHLLSELCGTHALPTPAKGRRPLILACCAAIAACLAFFLGHPRAFGDSIRIPLESMAVLWRDEGLRKITGFTLLGVISLALVLSARKRIPRFRLGNFGWFRVFHAGVGVTAAVLAMVHTGMHLGANLNAALMFTFLGVVATGAVLGASAAAEARGFGAIAVHARRWRPRIAWSHWLLLWVLPVLLGFHIVAVYYF